MQTNSTPRGVRPTKKKLFRHSAVCFTPDFYYYIDSPRYSFSVFGRVVGSKAAHPRHASRARNRRRERAFLVHLSRCERITLYYNSNTRMRPQWGVYTPFGRDVRTPVSYAHAADCYCDTCLPF